MHEQCGQRAKTSKQWPCLHFGQALLTLLIATATAQGLTATEPLASYGRQSWQADSGLPQSTVHAVLQTRDGFLWVATEGGLVRYDGVEFRVFDTANTPTLTSDTINDLAEDADGDLWIATADGLLERAAGMPARTTAFVRFTTTDGLPSNVVRSLRVLHGSHATGAGVAVFTAAGIAVEAERKTQDRASFQTVRGLGGDVAATLVAEVDGTLWVATLNGTVRSLDPGQTASRLAYAIPSAIGEVQAIAVGAAGSKDHAKTVWLGGTNGLVRLHGSQPARLVRLAASADVTTLLAVPDGSLWIGSGAGLLHAREAADDNSAPIASSVVGPPLGRVDRLFRDRQGAVWVAGELGLSRITDVAATPRLEMPLHLTGVLAMAEDREGDLWLGSDADGLTVLREQAVHTLTRADGLSDDFIRSVLQAPDGSVWVGTNRGGLNHIVGRTMTAMASATASKPGTTNGDAGLTSDVILALADVPGRVNHSAANQGLWIGTPDGLARLEAGHLHAYSMAKGLSDDFVRSLYADADGSLWVGTRNGLSHLVEGRFDNYSRLDGLGSELIGTVLRTKARAGSAGSLWVGTLGGLSRFDGSSFKTFTHADGLSGDAITTLAEDASGTLWIAAHGAGLTRLRNGVFTAIDSKRVGLPLDIFSILYKEAGSVANDASKASLWLGSSQGIYRVSLAALNALADGRAIATQADVTRFGVADGMAVSECSSGGHPAAWAMADGSLWFATRRGIATIDPGSGYDNRTPPLVAIEEVTVNERAEPHAGDAAVAIAPGENRLAIHYAGLSFTAPSKVRFRYRLIGFDRDWVDAGGRRTAYYTNLPPGSYRFEVMAANNDGVWSLAPAVLSLRQRPHLYQTIWFYLGVALALLALLYALYRWRALEAGRKYQLVLEERARIAREIHDTLAQGYVGVSVQLELVSRLLSTTPAAGQSKAIAAASTQLEATKALVRSSLAEARSSIWQLRANTDAANQGDALPDRLAASLERLRLQHQNSHHTVALRMEVQGTARTLDRRREDELTRIAEEAITNALRHAHATEIVLRLTYSNASLTVRIADDGIGFAADAIPHGHYGLKGIRERTAAIGAELRVDSHTVSNDAIAPASGTIIEVRCTLHHDHESHDA